MSVKTCPACEIFKNALALTKDGDVTDDSIDMQMYKKHLRDFHHMDA